jgi:hypothetical protein
MSKQMFKHRYDIIICIKLGKSASEMCGVPKNPAEIKSAQFGINGANKIDRMWKILNTGCLKMHIYDEYVENLHYLVWSGKAK